MNPVNLIIFATVFGLFVVITRKLFSNNNSYDPSRPPDPIQYEAANDYRAGDPAAIGAEIGLPDGLPVRRAMLDGEYNRPEVTNYFFKTIDLVKGPEDSLCFCDDFSVVFERPEYATPMNGPITWTSEYLVATPAGLQQLLKTTGDPNLFISGDIILMPRWDIDSLLRTVVEDMTEKNVAG